MTAFVVGNTLSSIPYIMLVSIVPVSMAYYLAGLQRSIDHFIYFASLIFTCMMLVESLMMVVASIVPDFLMGIITGAGIQGVMILNGGFFRLVNDLPKPFWKYPMYHISFHKYANQGFFKNEFLGLRFPSAQFGFRVASSTNSTISGEEVLKSVWQVDQSHSKWVDLGIVVGMLIIYRLMFLGVVKGIEKFKPSFCAFFAGLVPHNSKNQETIIIE